MLRIRTRIRILPPVLATIFLVGWPAGAEVSSAPSAPLQETAPAGVEAPRTVDNEAPAETANPDPDQEDDRLDVYDRVEVRGRTDDLTGLTDAASEGTTGAEDLQQRPIQRAGELVETVPGIIATQHSGGGKANQYFLRGFNLDHGTDFSIRVAGVPVNMPSHGHGQGYIDVSFLIPELVDRVSYRKGTYDAEVGDFSAAGSADLGLVRRLDEPLIQLSGGSFGFGRALVAGSTTTGGGDLTAALDLSHEDGPWTRPGSFEKANALVSFHRGDPARGFSVSALAYDGSWLSTDQVPLRAVESGAIGRFDLIDPGPRGETRRLQLSAELHRGNEQSLTTVAGYLVSYDFRLISNFTYLLDNPALGDQFEQVDDRTVLGFGTRHEWLSSFGERRVTNRTGLDLRYDDIDNGLFRTTELERFDTVRDDSIEQLGVGVWAESVVRWSDRFRSTFGLRIDGYDATVAATRPENSGSADDLIVSPKLALVFGPFGRTEYFLGYGGGFHSNDARGATIRVDPASGESVEAVDPLVAARGAEIGVRTGSGVWTTALSLFSLELDSELLFVGDGGATEASRPSHRLGVEWSHTWRPRRWLTLDADATWTDAEFTDTDPAGDAIPGAIGRTVAAGVTVRDLGRFSGSLRWRYFADTPLIEDRSAVWASASNVTAKATWKLRPGLDLELAAFNLLDREDSDIEYYYASRLRGEPVEGVEDVHFHPLERRSGRLTLRWRP